MRYRILLFFSACLYYSGLMRLINWLHRHSGQRLLIVNYHRASTGDLNRHLLYIRQHFRLRFLGNALEELFVPMKDSSSEKDRRLPLAVTFDDGYEDNYTYAYPLVRKLQIPITIFLVSGYIGCGTAFWWVDRLIQHARVLLVDIDDHTYDLSTLEGQKILAQAIDARFRSIVESEARREFMLSVSRKLCVPASIISDIDEEPASMLGWAQVQEMEASAWVQFGGHTLHHPQLASLTEIEEVINEVGACRSLLQEKLGHTVRIFAYPHGGIKDIGSDGVLAVQRVGYQWAVTTLQGVNTSQIHPFLIRRISVDTQLHWLIIVLMTSGFWDVLTYLNSLAKRTKRRKVLNLRI